MAIVEKRKGITCLVFIIQVVAGALHDHDDPFFNYLKHMVAQTLRKSHLHKHKKVTFVPLVIERIGTTSKKIIKKKIALIISLKV